MSDAVGFSVLVCVAALGLLFLAVHADPREHVVAAAIVGAVALPVFFVRPEAGLMLLLAAAVSGRLRVPPAGAACAGHRAGGVAAAGGLSPHSCRRSRRHHTDLAT